MRRKAKRSLIRLRFYLRRIHHRLGTLTELAHLTYFGVLFAESNHMYAKVGIICIVFSALYMMSEEE